MPLDPNPSIPPGSSPTPAPAVRQDSPQAAAPPPSNAGHPPTADAPAPPSTLTIPYAQHEQLLAAQTRLATLEAEQRSRDEAAQAQRIKLMAEKGDIEKALAEVREENKKRIEAETAARMAAEERGKRFAVEAELSRHLSSYQLVPGGAEQLTHLFKSSLSVDTRGESFGVSGPNYVPVKDFLAAKLGTPEYAHFIRATNPGGGTAGGPASGALASPTSPANPAEPPQPKNFGEAIIMQMQSIAKEQPSDPRYNPKAAMGLNRGSIAAMTRQG